MERLTYEIIDGGMVTDKENIKEFEIEDGFTVYAGNAVFRLAEYEDTGLTTDQIHELKERDTAKDPEEFDGHWFKCPRCGKYVGGLKGNFCHVCGQRLKWEE